MGCVMIECSGADGESFHFNALSQHVWDATMIGLMKHLLLILLKLLRYDRCSTNRKNWHMWFFCARVFMCVRVCSRCRCVWVVFACVRVCVCTYILICMYVDSYLRHNPSLRKNFRQSLCVLLKWVQKACLHAAIGGGGSGMSFPSSWRSLVLGSLPKVYYSYASVFKTQWPDAFSNVKFVDIVAIGLRGPDIGGIVK